MAPPAGMTLNSGGWFNRGCWYSQEEAIFLMRSERGRFKRILATEFDPSVVQQQTQTGAPPSALIPGTPINGGTYQLGEIIYVLTATTSVIQPLQFSLPLISAKHTARSIPAWDSLPGRV